QPEPSFAEALCTRLHKEGIHVVAEEITGSFYARQVLGYANDQKAGLILIESRHGQGTFTDYFTGPFAQQIVNHSKVPVLSVRARETLNPETAELNATGLVC
ncbi:MAG TPA: universal stress protein, partial [Chitinophagaceae bacterium]|nr:universal stress protein [Chitinophagaceae bacterium]